MRFHEPMKARAGSSSGASDQHETDGFRSMVRPKIVTWSEKSSSNLSNRLWTHCLGGSANEYTTSRF